MPELEISTDKLVEILTDPDTSKDVFNDMVERIQAIESMQR